MERLLWQSLIRSILTIVISWTLGQAPVSGQYIRHSLVQFQGDFLPVNPAWAGLSGRSVLEARYFGNFDRLGTLSRLGLVSLHGPSARGGRGVTMEFFKTAFSAELAVMPGLAWQGDAAGGRWSGGVAAGLRYFDFDDDGFGGAPSNFAVLEETIGLAWMHPHFHAALSAGNFFDVEIGTKDDNASGVVPRDRHLSFIAGARLQIGEDLLLVPELMLQKGRREFLPEKPGHASVPFTAIELLPALIIQDTYNIGVLLGLTDFDDGTTLNRLGLQLDVSFGQFHIGYAFVRNGNNQSLELPTSHMLAAGIFLDDAGSR